ncbi:MAG: hypothetical protein ACPGXK_04965 [Phycisphaerae bacterium]
MVEFNSTDIRSQSPRLSMRHSGCLGMISTLLFLPLLIVAGCGEIFQNQTASLGGGVAGSGGTLKTVFINNTNERAVFTFGTYNQTDRESVPVVNQFGIEVFETNLDGGETSNLLFLPCGRVFAVGSERLLAFLENNAETDDLFPSALEPGVQLFAVDGVDDEEITTLSGTADGQEYFIGTEFNCESLLVVRIEINDPGPAPFRLDFEVVPAESTR